jgi:two-component system chemotaxis response regulator CheY
LAAVDATPAIRDGRAVIKDPSGAFLNRFSHDDRPPPHAEADEGESRGGRQQPAARAAHRIDTSALASPPDSYQSTPNRSEIDSVQEHAPDSPPVIEEWLHGPNRAPAPTTAVTGPRIIVADDDSGIRQLLGRVLSTELHAEVVEVSDGLDVLEALKYREFDLAILDIEMGVLGGPDTLEAIRGSEDFRHLPVIAISGRADGLNVRRLKQLNVEAVLAKPLLVSVIRSRLAPLITQILATRSATIAATCPSSRVALRPSSRVFVVGADDSYAEFLLMHLEGYCTVTCHCDELAALRAAAISPPQLVFLTTAGHLMPPTVLARALGREGRMPRIVLCGPVDAKQHRDGSGFARLAAATTEALGRVFQDVLTDSGRSLALVHTAGAEILREWSRTQPTTALDQLVRIVHAAPPSADTEELAIEIAVPLAVDGLRWQLTLMVTQLFACQHAGRLAGCDTDRVSHEVALGAAADLARDLAVRLAEFWKEHHLATEMGALDARSTRWRESRITPCVGGIVWRLVTSVGNPRNAAISLAPVE